MASLVKQVDDKELLQLQVLSALSSIESVTSLELSSQLNIEHDKFVGIIKSLQSREKLNLSDPKEFTLWALSDEGHQYVKLGSPEARLFEHIRSSPVPVTVADLKAFSADLADVGLKNALKAKWLAMDKSTKVLSCSVQQIEDCTREMLKSIASCANEDNLVAILGGADPQKSLAELKKRKLADARKTKFYDISKGPQFSLELKKVATDLTQEMILSESWKELEFKPYNFFAAGVKPNRGSIHPLMRVLKKFKKILLGMQFEEMPTQSWVENSFWNFDTLFQPQQHPARDAQDTFFLKDPVNSNAAQLPNDYLMRVKEMHEIGGKGSLGWRYEWSKEESEKNILRTHTTANSARMLYKLAQQYKQSGVFSAKRYFSIDRVFRNETLDATHLAEFHQVEGLICDKGLGLKDLMGVMKIFYEKIGITQLKFKPAYNPYTEPSMEIFGFHPLLDKWIEVGNSGIFRPEMLLPMGFPEDVSVIAWGLSLERPTMIRYGVRNIRELFGHRAVLGVA